MSDQLAELIKAGLANVSASLDQKLQQYNLEQQKFGGAFDQTRQDVKDLSEQHAKLSAQLKGLDDSITGIMQKGVKMEQRQKPMSLGGSFIASPAFAAFKTGQQGKAKMEWMNNTITGETSSDPVDTLTQFQRLPGIISGAVRSLNVLDVIPTGTATGASIEFTRELSFTNSAAETAQAAAKPESAITFELATAPVRTIAHWLKVSKQVLDDAPMLQSYIDSRLSHGLMRRLETQILSGNGTAPNISGIMDSGNYTAGTVVTADNDFDAANRWKYQVTSGDYQADLFIMNPADWGRMERTKTGVTNDDRYLGADGAINYVNNGLTPTLWGLPVVMSNSVTAGKLICMARDAVMLFNRQGVTVEMFDSDEDNVQKNLLTVRAEMRAAFAVFRPAAIVYGTLPDA